MTFALMPLQQLRYDGSSSFPLYLRDRQIGRS
jgi:hypothetical protein